MRIGIIGKGNYGSKIYNELVKKHEIVFYTGKDMNISYDIDWVFIATPNNTHYELTKQFLENNINVFCEKPFTLSHSQSKELIELADSKNLKLYISDVFLWKEQYLKVKRSFKFFTKIHFKWEKHGSFKDNIYNNLTYHDIYMLIDILQDFDLNLTNVKFKMNKLSRKFFEITTKDNVVVKFNYNITCSKPLKHFIVNKAGVVDMLEEKNNALTDMLDAVLNNNVDFEYNHKLHLASQFILDDLNLNYKPKMAVVGAGIFGITTALRMDKDCKIDLYEKEADILQCASGINQYRIHRGYHYPRSIETAISSKQGTENFLKKYDCLPTSNITHYYAIANSGSFVDKTEYKKFLDEVDLEYTEIRHLNGLTNTQYIVEVKEDVFDPIKLKQECENMLKNSNVNLKLNTEFDKKQIVHGGYDYVINATYANINGIFRYKDQKDYQYEICEKPVVQLPSFYKGKSIVIMDGPFMCIDPLGDTGYHIMGNVVHAIHKTTIGISPKPILKRYLNKGIIKNPKKTNFKKFIKSAKPFFKQIQTAVHIGSMYTIRTVLPQQEHDDARPSFITKYSNSVYSIFSGKISTCVDIADELYDMLIKDPNLPNKYVKKK